MRMPSDPEEIGTPGPTLVATLPARYLAIQGRGEPAGPEFRQAAALLDAAMDELIAVRSASGHLPTRTPLEALYYPGHVAGGPRPWKVLHVIPWAVHPHEITEMRARLRDRRLDDGPVQVERLSEGRCLQLVRGGSGEPPAGVTLMAAARELGLSLVGPYHEIYLPAPHGDGGVGRTVCRLRVAEPEPREKRRYDKRGLRARGLPASWKRRREPLH